jgi:hypothetical protein
MDRHNYGAFDVHYLSISRLGSMIVCVYAEEKFGHAGERNNSKLGIY